MTIFLRITKDGNEYLADKSDDDLSEDLQKEFNVLLLISSINEQTDEMHLSTKMKYELDEIRRYTKNLSRKGFVNRSIVPFTNSGNATKFPISEPVKIRLTYPDGKFEEITEEELDHRRSLLYGQLFHSGRRFCSEYVPEWPVIEHNGMCKWYIRARMSHCGVPFVSRDVCLCGEDSDAVYGDKNVRFSDPEIKEYEYEV